MVASHHTPALFKPIQLGSLKLSHRVVMAPLTRMRPDPETQAQTLLGNAYAEYYSQRSTSGGLIISEAVIVSPNASGYSQIPALWSHQHIQAWKPITQSVHDAGGHIFIQLAALGRVAPPNYTILGKSYLRKGPSDNSLDGSSPAMPLEVEEIDSLINDFARAAYLSVTQAGFDGVEIHAANGFLIDQFLQSSSNQRNDQYGGTLENRFRFPLAVIEACATAIGADRVGIRLSPFSEFQGMGLEPDPMALFVPFVESILDLHPTLAYVHVIEPRIAGSEDQKPQETASIAPIRAALAGRTKLISAGGYKALDGIEAAEETGDLIAYGRYFVSNPDLVSRLRLGHPLSPYDRSTFYTPTIKGYTDYPTYDQTSQAYKLSSFSSNADTSIPVETSPTVS